MVESVHFNSTSVPLRVLTVLFVVHQKCPVKTESGGSREFGNGIFPSALSLPSAINWETPDFGPYLPVSRLEYEISWIIAESLPFLVDLTFQQY